MKYFDLNIDKILENWTTVHACRELIANALDESILSGSASPNIEKRDANVWVIRDFGRGLNYQSLIQSENKEKLSNSSVIGKFGIGLKDALATFDRRGIKIILRSRYGDISLKRTAKHSFNDIVTLHAILYPASNPYMIGTECELHGIEDIDMHAAKKMFVCFSNTELIENTKFGDVYSRRGNEGEIFINGMKVASEPNFLFSYNITDLTASLRKALNRERQNLGRTAYADRIKAILLASSSYKILTVLAKDLEALATGNAHEELSWIEIQNYAVKILNSKKNVVFVSPQELADNPNITYIADLMNHQIVPIPDNLSKRIQNTSDVLGKPVIDTKELYNQHSDSFEFKWIDSRSLSEEELAIWNLHEDILEFIGGKPIAVREIKISETMRHDPIARKECAGLWMPLKGWIIIHRSQLSSLQIFASTLLHEAIHAKYGVSDLSQEFEKCLSELSGSLACQLVSLNSRFSSEKMTEQKDFGFFNWFKRQFNNS